MAELGYNETFHIKEGDIGAQRQAFEDLEEDIQTGISEEEVSGEDPVTYLTGLVYKMIRDTYLGLFGNITKYVYWLPYILITIFGIPTDMANAIGIIFNVIQIIGLIQIITGRSFKGVE